MDRILLTSVYALILTRPRLGLLRIIFLTFVTRVMALDLCLNFVDNFVPAQYLENKWIEFYQILVYALILTRSNYI